MKEFGLSEALTGDHHFEQAGFRAIFRQACAGDPQGATIMNIKVIGCGILLAWQTAGAQDHLSPPTGVMFRDAASYDYCRNVNALFFNQAPRGYLARMFCRPGFNRPQWCVTVTQDQTTKDCTVEFVAAAEPISQTRQSLKIRVTRVTQPIDAETAALVEVVWRRLLRQVRYADRPDEGGDGDEFDLARHVVGMGGFDHAPGDPPLGSEAGETYEPDAGTFAARLVEIGQTLRRYTLAATAPERTVIRDQIRAQARQLDADVARRSVVK